MKLADYRNFRSCVYAAAYGAGRKTLRKLAREANPHISARKRAQILKSVYLYLEY
jgi:hypothetical protein